MEKEFEEIIKKNLPAQVGEVLKTRLEQADRDATQVKQQEELLKKKDLANLNLQQRIDEYVAYDVRNASLDGREKIIQEKERNLEIETLKFQLSAEKEKTDFSKQVALGLVRNMEYRKTVFDNESKPYQDQHGYTQYGNTTKNLDEKKSAE